MCGGGDENKFHGAELFTSFKGTLQCDTRRCIFTKFAHKSSMIATARGCERILRIIEIKMECYRIRERKT